MLKLLMRRMWQVGLLALAGVVALAVGSGQASAAPTTPAPEGQNSEITKLIENILKALKGDEPVDDTQQMVMVSAPVASSQTATLTAFEKDANGQWQKVADIGPAKAFLGEKGMGKAQDNVYRTPQGTFALNQAFGRKANPGTKMPYFQTTTRDWWDANPKSPTYNQHVQSDRSPGGDSENLYNMGSVYDYAVNINHNPTNTPGDASAIFLHVSNGEPTWGCVSTDESTVVNILKWLDPTKNPKITIGVNQDTPPVAQAETSPNGDVLGGLLGNLAALLPNELANLIPSAS
ncbi:L,D-peptidoglycan transpeptidase YkuD (ErfK/YbiS/YcfS/YnhG family) [Gordonia humi]|uniref:L,D-peptidoglycan transpeptidase YkuD (ErfK/YbiS/YcfS/YnhG family) n=2 Tax=Gordonia humi TaxID=686429 RepID=A0A840F5L6_9ACTN|nr:L,D-peptidoglycan transpeptidase YkuD (ErfK/YbiS/YcfS/YnhG family) [Gordonia humi]